MAGQKFGDKIKHYVKTDPSPTATIVFHGTVIGKSSSAPSPSSPGTAPSLTARRSPARSGDLNYPAFTAVFSSYKDSVTYHRVLSNVGSDANAVYDYEAKVESPAGVVAKMTPAKLVFDEEHRSLAYEITLAVSGNPVIVDDEKNK
ncbi:hypothetical protein ZWY2020_051894 [Hordeum vulgare]|nr:hypothetical protein ZWY2020_051894 [Hordeum vulgare]